MSRYALLLLLLLAAPLAAAPNGAVLYAEHCASCHGDSGHGGVGTPIALESFLGSVSDHYLFETIRQGRPGRVMPAFRTLSDAQVGSIVEHMRGWSNAPRPPEIGRRLPGNPVRGRALYAEHCAECHGDDGRGGTGTGVAFSRRHDLPIVPPALSNPGFLASASDTMLKQTILDGRKGTPMEPFVDTLSEPDVEAIIAYLRELGAADAAAEAPANEPLILVVDSDYGLEETVENVRQAAIAANFAVIRVDGIEHGLVAEPEDERNGVVVHFCNFKFLYDALTIDPRIGMFLPCHLTVIEHDGRVQILSVNPKALSPLFNNTELDAACSEMHRIYSAIMEEATL